MKLKKSAVFTALFLLGLCGLLFLPVRYSEVTVAQMQCRISTAQLANSHQAATEINLETAQKGVVAPLHPGAKRYYDELAAKK